MARAGHAEYSGTPLPKKLGIREGSKVLVVAAPQGFSLPLLPSNVDVVARAAPGLDVVLLFATRRAELGRRFPGLVRSLDRAGRLWVAWPKRASGVDTDLTFADVQDLGLAAGLVDNKSASIDETFQGVQFVYRLRDRG